MVAQQVDKWTGFDGAPASPSTASASVPVSAREVWQNTRAAGELGVETLAGDDRGEVRVERAVKLARTTSSTCSSHTRVAVVDVMEG